MLLKRGLRSPISFIPIIDYCPYYLILCLLFGKYNQRIVTDFISLNDSINLEGKLSKYLERKARINLGQKNCVDTIQIVLSPSVQNKEVIC